MNDLLKHPALYSIRNLYIGSHYRYLLCLVASYIAVAQSVHCHLLHISKLEIHLHFCSLLHQRSLRRQHFVAFLVSHNHPPKFFLLPWEEVTDDGIIFELIFTCNLNFQLNFFFVPFSQFTLQAHHWISIASSCYLINILAF